MTKIRLITIILLPMVIQSTTVSGSQSLDYKAMAKRYESSQAFREAYQVWLCVVSQDPLDADAWLAIKRLELHGPFLTDTAIPLRDVPSPPAYKELRLVTVHGDPASWTIDKVSAGIGDYLKYVGVLEQMGFNDIANKYRLVSARIAIKIGVESLRNGSPANCIKAYSFIEKAMPIGKLGVEHQRIVFVNLLIANHMLGQLLHSVAAAEKLTNLPASMEERRKDIKIISLLVDTAFMTVSWDLNTGLPRKKDTDDFLDTLTRAERDRAANEQPYGMLSPDEDMVTIFERLGDRAEFYKIIDLRLKQRNFELPVKVLLTEIHYYFQWGDPRPTDALDIYDNLVKQIEEAMTNSKSDKIDRTTVDAFIVGKKVSAIRKNLIQESKTRSESK